MTTECWISCVSQKREEPSLAKDLYISEWFKKARAYAESLGVDWSILSAKHGLVSPNQMIEPYELTLESMSIMARREWTDRVMEQMGNPSRVIILAGIKYRFFLEPMLQAYGIDVEVPMRKLKIGEQLSWLKRKGPAPVMLNC